MSVYTQPKKAAHFVLRFEAIGCPIIHAPVDGWMVPNGGEMALGCNKTNEKWYMRCDGRHWSGEMRTCTQAADKRSGWDVLGSDWSSPAGILIVTALGVALGLVIGVTMLISVLFCLK